MPNGIPVATVALNAAKNAGILAAKMIATSDAQLLQKLADYMEELKQAVLESGKNLG
jgi:5-(carboxyamino)imidazole ribonucleotide mutase